MLRKIFRNKIFQIIIFCLLFLILIVFFYLPGYSKYSDLQLKKNNFLQNIKKLEKENKHLREEIEKIKTDVNYLEKVLRDKMGLVKPGEVVYKLVKEEQ